LTPFPSQRTNPISHKRPGFLLMDRFGTAIAFLRIQ
jgi:hypothetical protein